MRVEIFITLALLLGTPLSALAQESAHNGLTNDLSNRYRVSDAKTRSIRPENFTGEKGKGGMTTVGVASDAARELGQDWKVNPFVVIEPGKTPTLAEINERGAIQHMLKPDGLYQSQQLPSKDHLEVN
jgi:hypothetical protein